MRRTVAVVGGGCSGVLVTRELLRCTDADVVMIEPGEPGGGLAYGRAARPWHLLNSRAGAMSADPDDAQGFQRYAGAAAGEFRSRAEYGRYLRSVFELTGHEFAGRLDVRRARATAVASGRVTLDGGREVRADDVVVATGNPAASRPVDVGHPDYIADPWRDGALDAIPPDVPVLLVGAGLTAVDVVLTLTSLRDRDAPITLVSRRGQLPLAHADTASPTGAGSAATGSPAPPTAAGIAATGSPALPTGAGSAATGSAGAGTADMGQTDTRQAGASADVAGASPGVASAVLERIAAGERLRLRDVVRAVRDEAGRVGDWRAVVDGLRPHLDRLWTAFTADEQEAFLRHLARPWECHRHRMAPAVASRVAELRADGRIEVRAGGIRGITAPAAGGFLVELEAGVQWFGAIVNCAGPGRLPGSAGDFAGGLLAAGQARVGPHGLGLDVDEAGRIVSGTGAGGRTGEGLWLIGPLRRGALWETTAVPEIRGQARQLALEMGRSRASLAKSH